MTDTQKPHPMQPVYRADDGMIRFRKNAIVAFLLDAGPFDMNTLAHMEFSDEDRAQFAQLIGYSVRGFGELSYVTDAAYKKAHAASAKVPLPADGPASDTGRDAANGN